MVGNTGSNNQKKAITKFKAPVTWDRKVNTQSAWNQSLGLREFQRGGRQDYVRSEHCRLSGTPVQEGFCSWIWIYSLPWDSGCSDPNSGGTDANSGEEPAIRYSGILLRALTRGTCMIRRSSWRLAAILGYVPLPMICSSLTPNYITP